MVIKKTSHTCMFNNRIKLLKKYNRRSPRRYTSIHSWLRKRQMDKDHTLKVWSLSNDTLTNINTLQGHKNVVIQVIYLTKDIIASAGALEKTIRIWNVTTYKKEVPALKEDFIVYSLLKLKNKDEMVLRRNIQLNVVGVSFVMQWLSCLIIVLLYTDLIQQ